MGLQFGDYTATSRGLTTINRGNRTMRTATRSLHADRQLLMLPNPPSPPVWRVPEGPENLSAVPVGGGGAGL